MPPISPLHLLDPTRRAILVALRRLGGATVEEVAAHCFLSVGAARQHLQSLEDQGLVAHEPLRQGPGRPRHRYTVTPQGESLFPRLDHEALANLLAALEAEPPELRERLIEHLVTTTIDQYRAEFERGARVSPARGVVEVMDRAGYLPELRETPEGVALTLHHCPLAEPVRRARLLCEAEARCLAAAFKTARVSRIAFRPEGDPTCAYLFELREFPPGDG